MKNHETIGSKDYVYLDAPDGFVGWADLWDNLPICVDKKGLSRFLFQEGLMTGRGVTLDNLNRFDEGIKFLSPKTK